MDASGLDLGGTEFVLQDLSGSDFSHARLLNVRLHDCNLRGASFRGADLRGARITDCATSGADFTNAIVNAIIGANGVPGRQSLGFSRTHLESTASFKYKDLSYCLIPDPGPDEPYDFRGFDLRGSHMGGDFSTTAFAGARIRGAKLGGLFSFVELRRTQEFKGGIASCEFWCRGPMDLSNLSIRESSLNVHDDETIDLKNARIHGSFVYWRGTTAARLLPTTRSYKEGILLGNTFVYSDMSNLNFDRMNLTGCSFQDCDLSGTTFRDAVVTSVSFRSARGLTVDQIKSTWNYKHDRMSGIHLPTPLERELLLDRSRPSHKRKQSNDSA
jgi:uncharacterized protein YjbI with pentapeptide repeats